MLVSIHASAREATTPVEVDKTNAYVSIHASAREATPAFGRQGTLEFGVSIHASAREATSTPIIRFN